MLEEKTKLQNGRCNSGSRSSDLEMSLENASGRGWRSSFDNGLLRETVEATLEWSTRSVTGVIMFVVICLSGSFS